MEWKSIKDELIKTYPFRTELHAHTNPASGCSRVSPEDMVRIYSDLGYDTVVITNHFITNNGHMNKNGKDGVDLWYEEFEKTRALGEKRGISVVLGAEIRFTENCNDYLVYGINREMLKEIYDLLPYGVENFRKNYKMPDSVFLQAHPFRDGMTAVDPAILDGMETMNLHQGHNSRIAIATRYAKENNIKIVTAGSDLHYVGEKHEGAAAMRSKEKITDSFMLATLLKEGDYIFEIGGSAIVLP